VAWKLVVPPRLHYFFLGGGLAIRCACVLPFSDVRAPYFGGGDVALLVVADKI
jgi:hypothetical protein